MKIIKIQFFILLVLLISIEIISSVLINSYYKKNLQKLNVDYSFSFKTIGDVKPNQKKFELNYFGRPFYVQFNDQGTRNKKNFCEECSNIFTFGDSQTFGLFINQSDTFVEKIQFKLNKDYRIYNLGQTGITINSIIDHYEDKFLGKIKNSIILFFFSYEDILTSSVTKISKRQTIKKNFSERNKFNKIKIFLKKYSSTYLLLSKIKNNNNSIQVPLDNWNKFNLDIKNNEEDLYFEFKKEFELFDQKIEMLKKLSSKDKNSFVAFFLPSPKDLFNKNFKIEKYLNKKNNYKLLSLRDEFYPHNLKDLYFIDVFDEKIVDMYKNDAHLTRFSNNIISSFVFDYLKNYLIK